MRLIFTTLISFVIFTNAFASDQIGSGGVASRLDVVIKAQMAGPLTSVKTELSKNVKKGALMALFSCKGPSAQIKVSEAREAVSKAEMDNKKHQLSLGVGTPTDIAIAEANYLVAQAESNAKKVDAGKCSIYSPFEGNVVELFVKAGEYIKLGDPLFHLVDYKKLYGKANVSREYWGNLNVNDEVSLYFRDLAGSEIEKTRLAKVYKKPNYIYTEEQTFDVELSIDNPDGLTSGMIFDIRRGQGNGNGQGKPE